KVWCVIEVFLLLQSQTMRVVEGEQEIIETRKAIKIFQKKDLVMLIKFISFAHAKMVNKRTVVAE
ncbi:hypothetical protein CMU99_11505, partial [Elizabethkingia anophelis]|nr:hypothetical protein [Elizabethkingia anophelis]